MLTIVNKFATNSDSAFAILIRHALKLRYANLVKLQIIKLTKNTQSKKRIVADNPNSDYQPLN